MAAYFHKGKGVWTVDKRWTLCGRFFRKGWTFTSRREAEDHDALFNAQVRQLKDQERAGKLTMAMVEVAMGEQTRRSSFGDFSETWLEAHGRTLKASTQATYERHLRLYLLPVFGKMDLLDLRASDIEAFQSRLLRKGHNANGTRRILATLSTILACAERWGEIDANPMRRVKKVRVPPADTDRKFTVLTRSEADAFLAACDPDWRPFFAFALATGMRLGELVALEHGDIGDADSTVQRSATLVYVKGHPRRWQVGTPKSGKIRTVPLGDRARAAYRAQCGRTVVRGLKLVFPSLAGNRYRTQGEFRTPFLRALRAAGVITVNPAKPRDPAERHVRFHDMRHTWATRHVEAGTAPEVLRRLGGWSSLAMVQRYAHATDEAMRKAQERVG